VKCSEERPVCHKCKIGNRQCYYATPVAVLFEPSGPLLPPAEHNEKRAFQFFREKSTSIFLGYGEHTKMSSLSTINRYLWTVIYPQCAATQESLRHMIIAVSSKHEQRLQQSTGVDDTAFLELLKVKHYSAALSTCSHQPMDSPEVLVLLAAMFIVYDGLTDNAQQTGQGLHVSCSGLPRGKMCLQSASIWSWL
jgi:hypothetical protein